MDENNDGPILRDDEETVLAGGHTGHPRRIGRYLIDGVLGEGAMGVVYKGFDTSIQRHVAIKTIRTELLIIDNSEYMERFQREAQAAGRLVHPNVVTVFEFGEHEGSPYLVLEYIPGRELKDLLKDGPLELDVVRRIFTQILAGLGIAHTNGVVHRDVKPQNIFVLPDGLTKVGDFGIARIDSTGLTRTGAQLGTPSYMSPEQFTGAAVDNRSDLYAAAALLHEMLAGEKAFTGTSITEVMYAVLEKHPEDLRQLNAKVPPSLAEVVRKGLAKAPADRYQSAREFSDAFEAACVGVSAPAPARRTDVTRFAATRALTRCVLPTISIGVRLDDELRTFVARRTKEHLSEGACALLQDAAVRVLPYEDAVDFLEALGTESERRQAVFTLASELSRRDAEPSELARFDAVVSRLVLAGTSLER